MRKFYSTFLQRVIAAHSQTVMDVELAVDVKPLRVRAGFVYHVPGEEFEGRGTDPQAASSCGRTRVIFANISSIGACKDRRKMS